MALPLTASLPQNASIVSRWKLNETSGARADDVGSNDLSDVNTVGYASGQFSENAADFEAGNAEELSIEDASQSGLDITGDMSFSCWIDVESLPSDAEYVIFQKSNHNSNQRGTIVQITKYGSALYGMSANTEGLLTAMTADGGAQTNKGVDYPYGTATWVFFTWTYDASAGEVKVFKDGSKVGSTMTGLPTSQYNNTATFALGRYTATGGSAYDGLMQDAIIWNVALSDAEVTSLYNAYFPVASAIKDIIGGGYITFPR